MKGKIQMKTAKKPISCRSAKEIMFDYLDGAASKLESSLLEDHVSECGDCKKELEERKKLIDTVKLTRVDPPAALKESVMTKIENIPQKKEAWHFKPSARITSILAVAACAVIMAAIGFRGFLFPGVTVGDTPANSGDSGVYAGDIPAVTAASARIFDTYADAEKVQSYSDTPVNTIDVKAYGASLENTQNPASEDELMLLDTIYDLAAEAVGENAGLVVGSAEPFEEIIADAEKSEIMLDGIKYDCYSVTENCPELVGRFMRGEFSTGEMWRANLPSGIEISEIRFIILDK